MRVYEGIARALVAERTEVVFALMAVDNMDLLVQLRADGVKVVTARNEHGAVAMADGYARATGRPGVCVVSEGPGVTQTGMALMTARRKRSPVVMITGETPREERHNLKRFDQEAYLQLMAGKVCNLRSALTVAEDVQLVFRHARLGCGPATLNAPIDVLESEAPQGWHYTPVTVPSRRQSPDPAAVTAAVQELAQAQKPILIAGRGVVASGARPEAEALADRVGALLGTTLQARGLFGAHPFSLGLVGGLSRKPVSRLIGDADCVLAIGTSLNQYVSLFGRLFPAARIIHIDADATRIGDVMPVDFGLVGDARATLAALNEELDRMGVVGKTGYRTRHARNELAASVATEEHFIDADGVLDPRQLLSDLDRLLPRERIVVTDSGHFTFFVPDHLTVPEPQDLIWSLDFVALSQGLPMAVGAAIARPDRHCVLVVGDGGFMMNPADLETAVRYRVPMTVIIMNDDAYGAELHYLRNKGKPVDLALFANPDLAAVARAFGAEAMTVRNRQELALAAQRAGRGDRPLVLDAKINRDVMHRLFEGAVRLSGGK